MRLQKRLQHKTVGYFKALLRTNVGDDKQVGV
jgi:hypothetical protein